MKHPIVKLLSLLLCAVMVFGMLPPVAVSAEEVNSADIPAENTWKYTKEEETEEVTEKEPPVHEIPVIEEEEEPHTLDAVTKSEYQENAYYIENFADLKEALALPIPDGYDWLSIYYHGTEPLVISEDITVPFRRDLYFWNSNVTIAEGVTVILEENAYLACKELTVNGTLNAVNGGISVSGKLTVNGSMITDGFSAELTTQIEGLDKIQFQNEWDTINISAYVDNAEEFYQAVDTLAAKVGGRISGSIQLNTDNGEKEIVLDKSVTLPEGVGLSTYGEYPVVIGPDCTLTVTDGSLHYDTLVVKGKLILADDVYSNGDVLQVDGTVDTEGNLWVNEKLTVNGSMNVRSVNLREDCILEGIDKIQYKPDDYYYGEGHLFILYNAGTAEEFYKDLEAASGRTNENVRCSVNLGIYEEGVQTTLDKAFTVPENVNVNLYSQGTITIDSGCKVTIDGRLWIASKVVLKGELVANVEEAACIESAEQAVLEISGGKITGEGSLLAYTADPASKVTGLDMNKYEMVEEWEDYWVIYNVEGLTKLPNPAVPKWGIRYEFEWNRAEEKYIVKEFACPTSIAMKGMDEAAYIEVSAYYEGTDGPEMIARYNMQLDTDDVSSWDIFQDESRPSGNYYFTLRAIGDYKKTRSSDVVTSEKYAYTNPGKKLDKVTNVKAENGVITWDAHPQADQVDYYTVKIYYAKTENAAPEYLWWDTSSETNKAIMAGYVVEDVGAGYYYFEVVAHPKDSTKYVVSDGVMSNGMKMELPETARHAGADRFETSFLVADALKSQRGWDKFGAVVIASGANFADALAGSYLAANYGAPILLSYKDKQNKQVKEYIKANLKDDGIIFILGGESAVPKSMESGLEAYEIVRLAGANRFDTNLEILKEVGLYRNAPILVATGSNFADCLSASAVGLPIMLVHKKLTAEQKDYLTKKANPETNPIYILGGEGAVNATVEAELKALGFEVKRLAGENRFETSVMIAEEFFGTPRSAVLAYAANYPDGLCGGVLAYMMGAPLILTMDKFASVAADYVKDVGIERAVTLGGTGLVSDGAVSTILGK